MICTSIEQSRRLLELGLDPKTADMFWMDTNSVSPCLKLIDDGIFNHRNYLVRFPNTSSLAWSLSALLDLMPLGTELYKMHNDDKGMYYEINSPDEEGWIGYEDIDPVTAAYEMVCWLLENGLIKKGDNDE